MYTIELFEKYDVNIGWGGVYWGGNEYLDLKSVVDFTTDFIKNYPQLDLPELYELAWGDHERTKILELIESAAQKAPNLINLEEEQGLKKWRYCILKLLRDTESNISIILNKVEIIYADFGYPSEMEEFIRYMPPKDDYDPTKHTKKENERRLIKKMDEFLLSERKSFS